MTKYKRVLICGGRDFSDETAAWNVLSALDDEYGPFEVIIHGGARGADKIADDFGLKTFRCLRIFKANWKKYGRAAGPIRNQRMLDEGKPEVVIAFPGGRGTADMMNKAHMHGIPVIEIKL